MSILSQSAQTLKRPTFVAGTNSQSATEDESEHLNRIRDGVHSDKSLIALDYLKKKPLSAKKIGSLKFQHNKQMSTIIQKDQKPAVQSILVPQTMHSASQELLQPITAKQKYSKTFHVQSQKEQ